mmetsp:Transcript_34415/g.88258  ORF Transcript_34415/g.88258 Transcript_34415/m.88258 type:complete len:278 (+) Transcript_34415:1090-1923(+)
MPPNDDRLLPARDVPRNVLNDDGGMKHGAVELMTDGRVRALPHPLQVEFQHTLLIRRDGCALDTQVVPLDGVGRIQGHLVICLVPVGDAQVIVINIHVKEWEDELLLDELPDDASHFIAIQLHHRVFNLDLLKGHVRLDGQSLRRFSLLRGLIDGDERFLRELPQLANQGLVAAAPLSELPQGHGLTAIGRRPDLLLNLADLEGHVVQVFKASIVHHPDGVHQVAAGHNTIAIHVTHGKHGLNLLIRSASVTGKQHEGAHLVMRDVAIARVRVEDLE